MTYHEHKDEKSCTMAHNKIHSENDKKNQMNIIQIERDVKTAASDAQCAGMGPTQILKSVLMPYGVIWVPTNLQKCAVNWVNNVRKGKKTTREDHEIVNIDVQIQRKQKLLNSISVFRTIVIFNVFLGKIITLI